MYILFTFCIISIILLMPLYFLSLEHIKLQSIFGKEKGIKIANIFGLISGWGFFLFLFGIWISPQPKFNISILNYNMIILTFFHYSLNIIHLIVSIPFILIGAWFGITGVKEITLKVAETHRPEKIITTNIYTRIRHPQYFGAILSHLGISILLSSLFSLILTPIIILLIYLMSWKEEKELLKEFGIEYKDYKKKVPMLIPRLRRKIFEK